MKANDDDKDEILDTVWPDLIILKLNRLQGNVVQHDLYRDTVDLIEDGWSPTRKDQRLTTTEFDHWLTAVTSEDIDHAYFASCGTEPFEAIPNEPTGKRYKPKRPR